MSQTIERNRLTRAQTRPVAALSWPRLGGFTLIELLTVLAIIAVLATLLASALSSAKRKARQAVCTSQLRQISLSLEMYLDDHEHRPEALTRLVLSRYLPAPDVLRCPEDRTGNWGGLVEGLGSALAVAEFRAPAAGAELGGPGEADWIAYSYLHPMPWTDWAWDRLMKTRSGAGVAACQVHGLGRPDPMAPSIRDFEGLVLRAQRDGAVVRRRVFWERTELVARDALEATFAPGTPETWRLFTDDPPP